MAALTADRRTAARDGGSYSYPVAASVTCYAGAGAVLDAAGNLKPAVTGTGLVTVGIFPQRVVNAGSAGAVEAEVRPGVYRFANSASADEITAAEIGDDCYWVDDQTVAKTAGTSTRSVAGKVTDVDDIGVWVKLGI